jgi:membrane associated rhomboid family serine protease
MLVLYSFGTYIEEYFAHLDNAGYLNNPALYYIILYIGGIIISSLTTLKKHKDDPYYNSVGASGAVSAVLFTSIFFAPWQKLLLYAVIPIPGILLGVAYLVYSQYMSKKGRDNVNHDAHFIGAIYGFIFPVIIDFRLVSHFINALTNF